MKTLNTYIKINKIKYKLPYINKQESYTILQVCDYLNIFIPRFCYSNELSISGNCRICLVELKQPNNLNKIIASCHITMQNEISITTNSEKIKQLREQMMEFILLSHPLDCPICDRAGECDLQDLATRLGIDSSKNKESKSTNSQKTDLLKSNIDFDFNKCIHCSSCIRYVDEVIDKNNNFLTFIGRGYNTSLTSSTWTFVQNSYFNKESFIFEFNNISNNLIGTCPVGAISNSIWLDMDRNWNYSLEDSINFYDTLCLEYELEFDSWNRLINISPIFDSSHLFEGTIENIHKVLDDCNYNIKLLGYKALYSSFIQNKFYNLKAVPDKRKDKQVIKKCILYLNFFESANYYTFLFLRSINNALNKNIVLGENLHINECSNLLYHYNLYFFLEKPYYFFESIKYKRINCLRKKHIVSNWLDYNTTSIQNNKKYYINYIFININLKKDYASLYLNTNKYNFSKVLYYSFGKIHKVSYKTKYLGTLKEFKKFNLGRSKSSFIINNLDFNKHLLTIQNLKLDRAYNLLYKLKTNKKTVLLFDAYSTSITTWKVHSHSLNYRIIIQKNIFFILLSTLFTTIQFSKKYYNIIYSENKSLKSKKLNLNNKTINFLNSTNTLNILTYLLQYSLFKFDFKLNTRKNGFNHYFGDISFEKTYNLIHSKGYNISNLQNISYLTKYSDLVLPSQTLRLYKNYYIVDGYGQVINKIGKKYKFLVKPIYNSLIKNTNNSYVFYSFHMYWHFLFNTKYKVLSSDIELIKYSYSLTNNLKEFYIQFNNRWIYIYSILNNKPISFYIFSLKYYPRLLKYLTI